MGLVLRPDEVKSGVAQVRAGIESTKESYSGALQTVQSFSQNEALQSESWDAAKNNILEAHQAIAQGMSAAQIIMENDLSTLESSVEGSDDLDEDILIVQIQKLTLECIMYEEMIKRLMVVQSNMALGGAAFASQLIAHYRTLLKKTRTQLYLHNLMLQALYAKESSTSQLFRDVEPLIQAVECAINDATVYIEGKGEVSDGEWKKVIPQIVNEINQEIDAMSEQDISEIDDSASDTGVFIGYLSYGADGLTENGEEGFFTLYDGPTLSSECEVIDVEELYQKYGMEPYGALQSFGGKEGPNTTGSIKYGNQEFDPNKGTLVYNGIERYAIAIGPKLQNPDIDCSQGFQADDMAYGTCVDISIQLDNQTYYIPAIIVDTKGHSAPTGIFQTGVAFNNGNDEYTGKQGPIVEWYTVQKHDGDDNKNISEGLNNFNRNVQLMIYREEVLK